MPTKIEISHRTVIFTVFFLVSIWLFIQIKEIIFMVFISLILTSALHPLVDRMEKLKIPRPVAIFAIYFVFFAVMAVTIAGVIPPLVDQSTALLSRLPSYVESFNLPWLNKEIMLNQLDKLGSLPEKLINFSVNIFFNIVAIFALGVITFYFLMERKNLDKYLAVLFLGTDQARVTSFIERLEVRLGRWVRAQIFLMFIIGLFSYLGLRILRIDFALPLALLAGFLEIIPNIGPTLSAVPAVIAGLAISPLYGVSVLVLYLFIQQCENTFIVPKVMEKSLGMNPVITIVVLSIGFKLAGILGILLALPTFIVIYELVSELTKGRS